MPAIPLRNYWDAQTGARIDDPNAVTFACVNGALGKCVRLGYRPWVQSTRCANQHSACSAVSLADYHQACTRMLRADYCGSGTSYTVNGTLIDVFDGLSPQLQSESGGWLMEAKWNATGATCLSEARHSELIQARRPPDCSARLPYCGDSHALPDALLGSTYRDGTFAAARRPSR